MNPLFLIPVAVVIAGAFFMIYMNKKHSAAKSEIDLDHERTKYDQYKQELLATDFSQLKQWIKGKSIDAFTAASVPQSTASKVQEMVTDGIKNVALSTVGVKLRRIVFDNFRIEKAQLQYGGILKSQLGAYSKSSEEYLPKTHIITFDMQGSPLSLEIHDRLNYITDPADMLNLKKQLETRAKYQVVGERFLSILQNKFPDLKIA